MIVKAGSSYKPKIKINWHRDRPATISRMEWMCCGAGLVAYANSPGEAYEKWVMERNLELTLSGARKLASINFGRANT